MRVSKSQKPRPAVLFLAAMSPDKLGGIESFAIELARQLDRRGWDLILAFEAYPPAAIEKHLLSPGNVTLEVAGQQAGLNLWNTVSFTRLVLRHRPKAFFYTLGGAVRSWPLIARMLGVRGRIYWDGTSRTKANINYCAPWPIRSLMSSLSTAICCSRFVKQCSDREEIVPPQKSIVLFNSVDNQRALGAGTAFRQQYGIAHEHILVLLVSWIVPEKGIDVALNAARQILNIRQAIDFVFCGDGPAMDRFKDLAEELSISEYVHWTGHIPDLAASGAFAAADIQIQCSQWHEAFCLAVAEGMSAGLPIVAARIGGLPELVTDGENGFLFSPASDSELAEGIVTLASDAELRKRMGARGRERALAEFDLNRNVEKWIALLLDRAVT